MQLRQRSGIENAEKEFGETYTKNGVDVNEKHPLNAVHCVHQLRFITKKFYRGSSQYLSPSVYIYLFVCESVCVVRALPFIDSGLLWSFD